MITTSELDYTTAVNVIRTEAKRAATRGDYERSYRILDGFAELVYGDNRHDVINQALEILSAS